MTTMVSVVIACRDAEAALPVQLDALSRQECPLPWQVVISDHGSRDGTVAVARGYAHRLPGLLVVDSSQRPNSSQRPGAAHSRNVGVNATQAPLLVFCDADGEAAPGWLAEMVSALQRDPFVAGRCESGRSEPGRPDDSESRPARSRPPSSGLQTSAFGPGLPHAGAGNLGLTRELFLAVGGFDADLNGLEDTDLCWRIQLNGTPLMFCPTAVMQIRLVRSSPGAKWRQGRSCGSAVAQLEHRYPAPAADPKSASPEPARPRPRPGFGDLPWWLGWHFGHRWWRAVAAPVLAQPLGSPHRQPGVR